MFEDMLAEWAGCCGACKIERSEEVYDEAEIKVSSLRRDAAEVVGFHARERAWRAR